jgi:transposase
MCCSGVWHTFYELGLSWKMGRQRHPKSNEESQTAFKKISSQS